MTDQIRAAAPGDERGILRLIHALADYEKEPDAVETTEADLTAALFPADGRPTAYAHVAEVDGEIVGIAVWFVSFSTWTGRNGIWLEDLFVDPAIRARGLGAGLLAALAKVCTDRGWTRLEWTVLDWNTPSIEFYRSLGAVPMDEWTTHRLSGDALAALAARPTVSS